MRSAARALLALAAGSLLASFGPRPRPERSISPDLFLVGVDIDAESGSPSVAFFLPVGLNVDEGESYDLVFISYASPLAVDGALELVAGIRASRRWSVTRRSCRSPQARSSWAPAWRSSGVSAAARAADLRASCAGPDRATR